MLEGRLYELGSLLRTQVDDVGTYAGSRAARKGRADPRNRCKILKGIAGPSLTRTDTHTEYTVIKTRPDMSSAISVVY